MQTNSFSPYWRTASKSLSRSNFLVTLASRRFLTKMRATAETPTKVLVIGGSYGGLSVALNLLDLCKGRIPRARSYSRMVTDTSRPALPIHITIVDERDGFLHLIGCPLALISQPSAAQMWVKFTDIPALRTAEISCEQGSAVTVDCNNKSAVIKNLGSGVQHTHDYDFLVVASGLRRVWPTVPQSHTRKQYLIEAGGNIEAIQNAKEGVVVIGGGAVGIEMAAEIKLVHPTQKVTLIHSRDKLLSNEPLPDEFKTRSLLVLKEAGVEVILNDRVEEVTPTKSNTGISYSLKLRSGSEVRAGHFISAISKSAPSTLFLPETALDQEGYIKVNKHLNFFSTPNSNFHYAVGDSALWSGIKRCGGALHMGPAVANNIYQSMMQSRLGIEPKFIEYPEHPNTMALAVGKQAVLYGPENGTTWGVQQMGRMFGEDLGFSLCWNNMQLGKSEEYVPGE